MIFTQIYNKPINFDGPHHLRSVQIKIDMLDKFVLTFEVLQICVEPLRLHARRLVDRRSAFVDSLVGRVIESAPDHFDRRLLVGVQRSHIFRRSAANARGSGSI